MIKIKKLREGFKLPSYGSDGSACRDIYVPHKTLCEPYKVTLIPTGFSVQVPYGYEMQLRMRSGLSLKYPGYLANGIGTIDSDFTDEVMVPFYNITGDVVQFNKHDRVCQCVIKECTPFDFIEVDDIDTHMDRGGGLGSTKGANCL